MRFVIQRADGRFVMLGGAGGIAEGGRYAFATPDARDAHDFGSAAAAGKWLRERTDIKGKVRELNDDGSWPLDD